MTLTPRGRWLMSALGVALVAGFVRWALAAPTQAQNLAIVLVILIIGATLAAVAIISHDDAAARARRDREWDVPVDWDEVSR